MKVKILSNNASKLKNQNESASRKYFNINYLMIALKIRISNQKLFNK